MGLTFRKYWIPALLSREIQGRDSAPVRVKILGEDFVAFRDSEGKPGVVQAHCPHRGAHLFFGRTEDCGIRCAYHGWHFTVEGECTDIPIATPEVAERMKPKARIRALHVREAGDVVWVHFGSQPLPELPDFEFAAVPAGHRYVSKKLQQCNWAQAVEGGLDTAHFSYLHAGISNGTKVGLHEAGPSTPSWTQHNEPERLKTFRWLVEDGAPRFQIVNHAAGMLICAARTADDDQLYYRMTQYLMPNHSLTPGNAPQDTALGNTWVPIDDHSCWVYCYAWHPERPINDEERSRLEAGSGLFPAMDESFTPVRRRENDYLISRERQRTHSFTGIHGISEQDQAIADSQGLIADRTNELLCQTDIGVVRFREMILNAAQEVENERVPRGVDAPHAYRVRSGDVVVPQQTPIAEVLESRFGEMWGHPLTT